MNVYVASPLKTQTVDGETAVVAQRIQAAGMKVVSTWHSKVRAGEVDPEDHSTRQRVAIDCLAEVDRSHALVALLDHPTHRPRGTFVEYGYAYGRGKIVVAVLGSVTSGRNVFDALPGVHCVATVRDAIATLARLRDRGTHLLVGSDSGMPASVCVECLGAKQVPVDDGMVQACLRCGGMGV